MQIFMCRRLGEEKKVFIPDFYRRGKDLMI